MWLLRICGGNHEKGYLFVFHPVPNLMELPYNR